MFKLTVAINVELSRMPLNQQVGSDLRSDLSNNTE